MSRVVIQILNLASNSIGHISKWRYNDFNCTLDIGHLLVSRFVTNAFHLTASQPLTSLVALFFPSYPHLSSSSIPFDTFSLSSTFIRDWPKNIFIRRKRHSTRVSSTASLVFLVQSDRECHGRIEGKPNKRNSQQMRMTFLSFVFFYMRFPSVLVLYTSLMLWVCVYILQSLLTSDYVFLTYH